ncbi:PREDICTED: uncharacterized protein LOC104754581 [Camelina sativa]|uniref:Uncharacterized protein LOC104754581 n=1 Tax=Camelina sativa TaxID=90675 RepID=A0ABM0WRG0_CAMSA|nr:PREDICTED: uncharacterized protein LOC104754581 [Camelina sativa]
MIMPYSKPQECGVCKRVFIAPQHLMAHIEAFHSSRHFPTFASPAAASPASTFHHFPNQLMNRNRNPNPPTFQARTHLDYYRRGYLDDQGNFHKGFPPAPAMTPERKYKFLLPKPKISKTAPKLMDLFPEETSLECIRTLPLICQLERRRPEETVTENGGVNSSYIDLSLRL